MNCYMDSVSQEALAIAGAQVNIHKLLGVHEQTKLVDLTGDGNAISSGDSAHFPASNAFETLHTEWRSRQSGSAVTSSAFLGYDFGYIKNPSGRQRYGVDTSIRQHITALKIKQSENPLSRVTKVRVERSDNGKDWFGVAIVALPHDDQLNTVHFKHSAPMRYWRLRPITFTGGDCDIWSVQALELYDYTVTHISNIQDKLLLENRDRDYQQAAVMLKGYYDLQSPNTDLSRFGIEIPMAKYMIKVNFNACVAQLGRPIVIGDIIELPSETQYTPDLQPVKRWLEVSDVTWDGNSYTPGWQPTMLLVTCDPAMATQETQDLFGDLAKKHVDNSGLFGSADGNSKVYQDLGTVTQTIVAQAEAQVPERGADGTQTIRYFDQDELEANKDVFPRMSSVGLNNTGLYVEDAMPKNDAPYTEGPEFPSAPKNGDYHRLTYVGLAKGVPARLHRYSQSKSKWVYMETDRRAEYNNQKQVLAEYTTSKTKTFASEIK